MPGQGGYPEGFNYFGFISEEERQREDHSYLIVPKFRFETATYQDSVRI